MKFLFLAFLISFSAMASNWMPVSKIQSQSVQAYQLESECLKTGEQCIDVGDDPRVVAFTQVEIVDGNVSVLTDEAAFISFKSQLSAAAQMSAALGIARKMRECGEGIIDIFLVRNSLKNLSIQQVEELSVTFAPVQMLLLNGSLNTAKAKILEADADGVKVTNADKAALIVAADKCLGL